MKLAVSAVVVLVPISAFSFAQTPANELTRQEIAEAYRLRSWPKERIKEIRGWSLSFKRINQERSPGVITVNYNAVAKKNDLCAEYHITDTMVPGTTPNIQIKPILVVEPSAVKACR